MRSKPMIALYIVLSLAVLLAVAIFAFMQHPSFGRLPRGARLARIERSPNYRNGQFHNLETTPQLTSGKSRVATMIGFLFREKTTDLRPPTAMPALCTDLHALDASQDALIWFGHSSYLIQLDGYRVLVDPALCTAAPLASLNKPFAGADLYTPDDMPSIDLLVITHDHWDHLDYQTILRLRDRIGRIVCPLGVGEHFERWGFAPEQLVELDWQESASPSDSLTVHCLPARHFSGRGLKPNRSLWASFLLETPSKRIYIAGDGGHGSHLAQIGQRFPGIDLAILENGQYNTDWRYIHTLPDEQHASARELGAQRILTVHHSKYALARHPWDEPLRTAQRLRERDSLDVLIPTIGEVVRLSAE